MVSSILKSFAKQICQRKRKRGSLLFYIENIKRSPWYKKTMILRFNYLLTNKNKDFSFCGFYMFSIIYYKQVGDNNSCGMPAAIVHLT